MVEDQFNQEKVLNKLGIKALNEMQKEAGEAIRSNSEIIILSPTGTGKTLAFLLPILAKLEANCQEIQALIIVPARELAIQIEQVIRSLGTGYKAIAVYGGRSGTKDTVDIKHRPAILIGTPGRIADHLRREKFDTSHIKSLVLDEFDKSLEIGFKVEMEEIINALPAIEKKVLTSATFNIEVPEFVGLKSPKYVKHLDAGVPKLQIKTILSPDRDKLSALVNTLQSLGNQRGIVFCNFKDSIQFVSDYLSDNGLAHGSFFGGMEQKDRERALIKFRNGTYNILLATDLAARGIDVPEIEYIIHYQLPLKEHEFVHRNGRTARMHQDGTAYILHYEQEELKDYITENEHIHSKDLNLNNPIKYPQWKTLFISGGRKDKISKGDILGLFTKQGKLKSESIGKMELMQDCAFVAIDASKIDSLIQDLDNSRLKKKKVRLRIV